MAAPQLSDRLLTAEEFFELPDPPEGGKMELICGKVVRHMPVSGEHGQVATELSAALHGFVKANRLGRVLVETGFRLRRNPDSVRAPDISFVSHLDVPESGFPKDGFLPFRPTLAIEVVSPGDLESEVATKLNDYQFAGVQRVWVVRPKQRTVTVYHAGGRSHVVGAGGALTSDDAGFAVAGFELKLDELFTD